MLESNSGSQAGQRLTAREWALLAVLAAIQFTHIVDFMIVMPLGPAYIKELRLTPAQFGHIVEAYTVAAGVAALAVSRVLDRFGRKAALLTLYTGFTLGTALCAVAPGYWTLLAARVVAGACGGVAAAVVYAIIGDAFHDARRGTATGVVMSSFSVASVAGVPLGIWFADRWGWHAPFAILAGLAVPVLALAAVTLPPFRGHFDHTSDRPVSTLTLLADPNHVRAFVFMLSLVFATFTVVPYLPTFLRFNVGLTQRELMGMYVAGGIATLASLTYFGKLADRLGKLRVFRVLAVATMVAIVILTNLPTGLTLAAVLATTTLMFITSSGRMVPAMALITATAVPAERAGFLSVNTAVQHLGCGVAAALAGLLLTSAGDDAPLSGYGLAGLASAAASVASLFLAGRLRPAPGAELAPESPELLVVETDAEVAAS